MNTRGGHSILDTSPTTVCASFPFPIRTYVRDGGAMECGSGTLNDHQYFAISDALPRIPGEDLWRSVTQASQMSSTSRTPGIWDRRAQPGIETVERGTDGMQGRIGVVGSNRFTEDGRYVATALLCRFGGAWTLHGNKGDTTNTSPPKAAAIEGSWTIGVDQEGLGMPEAIENTPTPTSSLPRSVTQSLFFNFYAGSSVNRYEVARPESLTCGCVGQWTTFSIQTPTFCKTTSESQEHVTLDLFFLGASLAHLLAHPYRDPARQEDLQDALSMTAGEPSTLGDAIDYDPMVIALFRDVSQHIEMAEGVGTRSDQSSYQLRDSPSPRNGNPFLLITVLIIWKVGHKRPWLPVVDDDES
ncbi:hypothetical protein NMY22_g4644 [Coprinellus aureogranulatus]|nr:hypothetical protein NMY22_g4644 [Coprinellus aureogranulatus]